MQGVYHDLLQQLGPELDILRHVEAERIAQCGYPLVAEGVRRMRTGRIAITPGYDSEYGVIQVFTPQERRDMETQRRRPQIVVLSATQQAARQVAAAFTKHLAVGAEEIVVGTIQDLATKFLAELAQETMPTRIDEVEALSLLYDVIAGAPTKPPSLRFAHKRIRRWKRSGLRPFQVAVDPLAMVYAGYQERLRVCGANDVDDALLELVGRLRASEDMRQAAAQSYQHLLVDEYQELTSLQLQFVHMLAGAGQGLFVTVDPDRSGQELSACLQKDYAEARIYRLADNHRSVSAIGLAARAMLHQQTTTALEAASHSVTPGQVPTLQVVHTDNEVTEAEAVAVAVANNAVHRHADIVILTRTGEQLDLIEKSLTALRLSFRTVGETAFLQERGARDAVAFFRYALQPTQPLRPIEALRTGPFDVGSAARERLSAALGSATHLQQALAALPTMDAAQVERLLGVAAASASMVDLLHRVGSGDPTDVEYSPNGLDAVSLMTIQTSMGLEFPVVFICGVEGGLLPLRNAVGRMLPAEQERRLFYLALTRAKEQVFLTRADQRTIAGLCESRLPSPFLADIPARLLGADQLTLFSS